MAKRTSNDGKFFEKFVRMIQEAYKDLPDTEILSDVKLTDKMGGKGQIDILIRIQVNGYKLTVAVECKDYNKPVSKEKIDAFYSKCDMIEEIDKIVFVSKSGYQVGAVNAAKYRGIELYNVEDVTIDIINTWKDLGNFFQISVESLKNINYTVFFDNGNKWLGLNIPPDTVTVSERGLLNFKLVIHKYIQTILEDYAIPAITDLLFKDFEFYIANDANMFEEKMTFEIKLTEKFVLGWQENNQKYHTPIVTNILFEMQVVFKIHRPTQMMSKKYTGIVGTKNRADILQIKMDVYDLNLIKTESVIEPKYFKTNDAGHIEELKVLFKTYINKEKLNN